MKLEKSLVVCTGQLKNYKTLSDYFSSRNLNSFPDNEQECPSYLTSVSPSSRWYLSMTSFQCHLKIPCKYFDLKFEYCRDDLVNQEKSFKGLGVANLKGMIPYDDDNGP